MPEKLGEINVKNQIQFKPLGGGQTEVSFVADNLTYAEKIKLRTALETAGNMLTLNISKYRKKRSIDANNYLWQLIGELAEEMGLSDVELYRDYIKEHGVKKTADISDDFYKTVSYVWSQRGIGWFSEKIGDGQIKGNGLYMFYYGSSCYNSKQMSRLINAVVEDCKSLGIETMPPDEIDSLTKSWREQK